MNQRRTVGLVIEEGGPVVQRGDAHWLRRGRSANSRVGGSGARKRRERGGLASSEQVELGDVQLRRERGRKRARREGGKAARDGAFLYSQGVFQVGRRPDHARLGGRWLRSSVFSPLQGTKNGGDLQAIQPIATHYYVTARPGSRPDQASYISHMRSLGLEEAAC